MFHPSGPIDFDRGLFLNFDNRSGNGAALTTHPKITVHFQRAGTRIPGLRVIITPETKGKRTSGRSARQNLRFELVRSVRALCAKLVTAVTQLLAREGPGRGQAGASHQGRHRIERGHSTRHRNSWRGPLFPQSVLYWLNYRWFLPFGSDERSAKTEVQVAPPNE